MESGGGGATDKMGSSPPPPTKPSKFAVYQNPALSAALTANSLQPSKSSLIFIFSLSSASAFVLLSIISRYWLFSFSYYHYYFFHLYLYSCYNIFFFFCYSIGYGCGLMWICESGFWFFAESWSETTQWGCYFSCFEGF